MKFWKHRIDPEPNQVDKFISESLFWNGGSQRNFIFSQIHYMMAICPHHHHDCHRRCVIVHRNIESIKSPSYLNECVCVWLIIIMLPNHYEFVHLYIFYGMDRLFV